MGPNKNGKSNASFPHGFFGPTNCSSNKLFPRGPPDPRGARPTPEGPARPPRGPPDLRMLANFQDDANLKKQDYANLKKQDDANLKKGMQCIGELLALNYTWRPIGGPWGGWGPIPPSRKIRCHRMHHTQASWKS